MKKQEKELYKEIARLEELKNFFKHQAVLNRRKASFMSDILDIESMYIDMYYNTAENLRKLNWFQKLIIGYDKLNKSNERIKDNYTRATSYKTSSGGFSQGNYSTESSDADKESEAKWLDGWIEGVY
jgi:hypothetical protein